VELLDPADQLPVDEELARPLRIGQISLLPTPGLRLRFGSASRPAKRKFKPNVGRLVAICFILKGNSNRYRMGQVNSYGESRASERVFGSMRARRSE
jgi:hypothetical protein